ncbi:MAG: hypothetical protein AB2L11_11450 [Syntrophobacteraceae bacterium]
MIRLILYALIIYFGYRLFKHWGKSMFGGSDQELAESDESVDTELIQDPQCGTYFLRQRGVEARIDGRLIHFCSESCRDAYLKEHQNP